MSEENPTHVFVKTSSDNDLIQSHEHELILHEFDYIAQTATQAQEDRVQVLAQYLTFGAALAAAAFALTGEDASPEPLLLVGLGCIFFLLWFIGLNSIKHMARLRKAWLASAKAMNTIKEQYIDRNEDNLSKFLPWQLDTLPKVGAPSVAKLISWNITLIGAASFTAGVSLFALAGVLAVGWQFTVLLKVLFSILVIASFAASFAFLRLEGWHLTLFPPDKNGSSGEAQSERYDADDEDKDD